jgi:hypothetical protein
LSAILGSGRREGAKAATPSESVRAPGHRRARLGYMARLAWSCLVITAASTAGASAEVYFSDAAVEISGNGPRASRRCRVALMPTRTLGAAEAPRLILSTDGMSKLSFGIDKEEQYRDAVIVRDNLRRPYAGSTGTAVDAFLATDLAKALRSRRPFFVTARLGDKYVSSRYELDFDAILARIEPHCPFDAEALMSDASSRERGERALGVPEADLTLIRWALNKRYAGSSAKPEARSTLSATERTYLKRYGADNGLPLTQYLTADSVRHLKAEGATISAAAQSLNGTTITIRGKFPSRGTYSTFEMMTRIEVQEGHIVYLLGSQSFRVPRSGETVSMEAPPTDCVGSVKHTLSATLTGNVLRLEHGASIRCGKMKPVTANEAFTITLAGSRCSFSYVHARHAPPPRRANPSANVTIANETCSLNAR